MLFKLSSTKIEAKMAIDSSLYDRIKEWSEKNKYTYLRDGEIDSMILAYLLEVSGEEKYIEILESEIIE